MTNEPSGTVLITGAARRIGKAIVDALAEDGWRIALHYGGSAGEAEAGAAELRARGAEIALYGADLRDEAQVRGLIPRIADEMGSVDCLVNNASVFERDSLGDAARESWDAHMEVNLRAPFVLTQAFADRYRGENGNIINILDQRVWNLTPHFSSYTLSKAGLWTLTQTTAQALAPAIRVNAVGPGPTLPSPRQSEDGFRTQWERTPLARPVGPQEIASAVRFILATPSMTGQMIALDSGQHLGWASPAGDAGDEDE